MAELGLGVVTLAIAAVLQSAVLSRMPLLNGLVDLIMLVLISWCLQKSIRHAWGWGFLAALFASIISGLPVGAAPLAYIMVCGVTIYAKSRFGEIRLLLILALAIIGTLIIHVISVASISLTGTLLPLDQAFNLVTLPSILLNLLAAIPVYMIIRDIAGWLYPEELET
jgi:cell shape-determining protein MreD